jgi:hypothetical protein
MACEILCIPFARFDRKYEKSPSKQLSQNAASSPNVPFAIALRVITAKLLRGSIPPGIRVRVFLFPHFCAGIRRDL